MRTTDHGEGRAGPTVERVAVTACRVPTDAPESDGTLAWSSTTLVIVEVAADGAHGLGYGYADVATAHLIDTRLGEIARGQPALAPNRVQRAAWRSVRNLGHPGIAAMAISALDTALWDLKARLLGVPLASLLGAVRDAIPAYGSGGFTSQSIDELQKQLGGWAAAGLRRVKMKVGREPAEDPRRVAAAREAIGPDVALFVDANGAYDRKQALHMAERFAEHGVVWFEEPVTSDDPAGLRLLRDRAPAGMEIAAGEYGYDPFYFRRLLAAGAVDVLQADATRCMGVTGFLVAGDLCEAWNVPLSAHTAPALHVPLCCALPAARHVEWFHDHVRIEHLLFDGAPEPSDGQLSPDPSRPGLGLSLRREEAARFRVYGGSLHGSDPGTSSNNLH